MEIDNQTSIMSAQMKRQRIPVDEASCTDASSSKKRALSLQSETVIKIVSASYGPSEGRRSLTGELNNDESSRIPLTRDVTPFLRALLMAQQYREGEPETNTTGIEHGDEGSDDLVRLTGQQRNFFPIMDGQSMNAVFGDPSPGLSKRLKVHYVIYESMNDARSRAAAAEVHRVCFAEHERVTLRRRTEFYQDDTMLRNAVEATTKKTEGAKISPTTENGDDESTLRQARRLGRSQSIADFAEVFRGTAASSTSTLEPKGASNQMPWRMRSAMSEIVLPIILPFLEVRERVQCQLVGRVWRLVVKNWGVAQTIDVNDEAFPNFTPDFLRGILAHSHHSLQSLFLNDFQDLSQDDLHPALPHLRKLRSLDISRCNQLDDYTMHLIASHLSDTLEVLYLKGLRKVTDIGLTSICKACLNLRVLEISNIPITDLGAICIGENLTKLSALYARDNFLLTNLSIDVITKKCTHLTQLTLWGCTRLRHLSFAHSSHRAACGKLVLLNLWGCHSLLDDTAVSLGLMKNLRSLIVSECHRLTNAFLFGIAKKMPQLNHLYLRYCKRVTDDGVHAIANSLQNLYSLDLSFCTQITSACIANLLELRHEVLLELRLQHCTQLDIVRQNRTEFQRNARDGRDGLAICQVALSLGKSLALNMLDLRNCETQFGTLELFPIDDPFVEGMAGQRFEQKFPGLFVRPASLNATAQLRVRMGLQGRNEMSES
jgi:hypothetical protein